MSTELNARHSPEDQRSEQEIKSQARKIRARNADPDIPSPEEGGAVHDTSPTGG